MSEKEIIKYRDFDIELLIFGDALTSVEVKGDYSTSKYNKIDADITKSDSEQLPFKMVVNLTDDEWIHLGVSKMLHKTKNECISFIKHCINVFIYNEFTD